MQVNSPRRPSATALFLLLIRLFFAEGDGGFHVSLLHPIHLNQTQITPSTLISPFSIFFKIFSVSELKIAPTFCPVLAEVHSKVQSFLCSVGSFVHKSALFPTRIISACSLELSAIQLSQLSMLFRESGRERSQTKIIPMAFLQQARVIVRNDSWPAVSQTWIFTSLPKHFTFLVANQTPMVGLLSPLKMLLTNIDNSAVLPTDASPTRMYLKTQSNYKLSSINIINPMHTSAPYLIGRFQQLAEDVQQRTTHLRLFSGLLERKVALDISYARKINVLLAEKSKLPKSCEIASQLYDQLFSLLQAEAAHINKLAHDLQNGLLFEGKKIMNEEQAKRSLILGQSLEKNLASQRQKVEKSSARFQRKNGELQGLKVQYMSAFLSGQSLEKRNRLSLRVSCLTNEVAPLQKDYYHYSYKYNESLENNAPILAGLMKTIHDDQLAKLRYAHRFLLTYHAQRNQLNYPLSPIHLDALTPFDEQAFIAGKQRMLKPFVISSAYIDSLFSRMESKWIESIVLHGDIQHKMDLSAFFDGVAKQGSTLEAQVIKMVQLFKKFFEAENPPNQNEFKLLISGNSKMRKQFIFCLQKYRINKQFILRNSNFNAIMRTLEVYLNECMRDLDTYNAKQLMVLSLTYYFQHSDHQVDLQQLISHHKIWKDISWWEAALLESIYEETKMKNKKAPVAVTIWDIKGDMLKQVNQGEEMTFQNVAFNQLAYYLHNMTLFHLQPPQIRAFAGKYVKLLGFIDKMAERAMQMCPRDTEEENTRL